MKACENNAKRTSVLTRILVELPLEQKHRLIAFRMAINKSLKYSNYKFAAKLIKVVIWCHYS